MISQSELVDAIETLDANALQRWVEWGWVLPRRDAGSLRFDPSDVARVHLICELRYELLIEEDSMSVVLSLMDQLYATRRALGTLSAAVAVEPADVRTRIAQAVGCQRLPE
jgi:chaperone modulatory protein CbpM